MRINLLSISRAKKSAKALASCSGKTLSFCQQSLAKVSGYRDWRDLEQSVSASSGSLKNVPNVDIKTEVDITASLSRALSSNAGDVQHALATARFFGSASSNFARCLTVRGMLFEKTDLPPAGRRQRGQVGKLKTAGRNGEHVILRSFGKPVRVITHKSADGIVASHEFVSPRTPLPLFIPMRLFLPYGVWEEPDGARILFSRDYCPLWRIREDSAPERVRPWEQIKFSSQSWYWDDGNTPWSKEKTYTACIKVLEGHRVRSMPLLVDALPIVILHGNVRNFTNAVELLKANHLP
jgi:hypothetical protein